MMITEKINNKKNMPKLLLYFFAFTLVFFAIPHVVKDTDYMWHIKLGEYIFENKTIPTTNIFGYFDTLKFFAHEWLFDLIIYLFYYIAGDNGVKIFIFLNVCFMIHILEKILSLKNNSAIFNTIVLFISMCYMSDFLVARPQTFSYNLILSLIYILLTNFNNLSKKFINLAIITVLIVNAHAGAYPIIFAILGIYIFGQFIDKILDSNKENKIDLENNEKEYFKYIYYKYLKDAINHIKKPVIVSILLIPFLLINPYTFDIYFYPFQVMANDIAMNAISEWHATHFVGEYKYLLLYVMFILTIFTYKNKNKNFTDWFFIIIFVILSAKHIRHTALLTLILTIFTSNYLYCFLRIIYNKFIHLLPKEIQSSLRNSLSVLIKLSIYTFILTISLIFIRTESNYEKIYPYEILNYIEENNIDLEKNVMFNDYNIGGFLIRNNKKVFIDGRADVYSKSVNKKQEVLGLSIDIIKGVNWKESFEKYKIKYALVSKTSHLGQIIQNNSSFKILKEDMYYIFAEYNLS